MSCNLWIPVEKLDEVIGVIKGLPKDPKPRWYLEADINQKKRTNTSPQVRRPFPATMRQNSRPLCSASGFDWPNCELQLGAGMTKSPPLYYTLHHDNFLRRHGYGKPHCSGRFLHSRHLHQGLPRRRALTRYRTSYHAKVRLHRIACGRESLYWRHV